MRYNFKGFDWLLLDNDADASLLREFSFLFGNRLDGPSTIRPLVENGGRFFHFFYFRHLTNSSQQRLPRKDTQATLPMAIQARDHFQSLLDEILKQSPQTLAAWRLRNEKLVSCLRSFATRREDDDRPLVESVLALFDRINPILAEQEQSDGLFGGRSTEPWAEKKIGVMATSSSAAIVFGGKYSIHPRSISELLVSKLSSNTHQQVWTVSRSEVKEAPSTITHISRQRLDQPGGNVEFEEIIRRAVIGESPPTILDIYFSLGQHKGINPFVRNLQAANNFASALEKVIAEALVKFPTFQWRIILTGTDATLPSTHPHGQVTLNEDHYTIPTYKISEYNYTYAMSKLGQYYRIGQAVAHLTGAERLAGDCAKIYSRIQAHVMQSGKNANYDSGSALVRMEELDEWSRQVDGVLLPALRGAGSQEEAAPASKNFVIAQGISICYTPLHAHPWSEQALNQDKLEPTAYILEQVMKRLKNAISIEQAVEAHRGS